MSILILTTNTIHHSYYVREILKKYPEVVIFCETKKIQNPFKNNNHKFDIDIEKYEIKEWFNNKNIALKDFKKIYNFNNLNSEKAIKKINSFKPNLIISFGIGKLTKHTLKNISNNIYNLHGGNPEKYRGLDSYLWGIYHNDFKNIMVSLHKLDTKLDSGRIFLNKKININLYTKIYHIRKLITEATIILSLKLIKQSLGGKKILLKKQINKSRYYSVMPLSLKNIIFKKYKHYINKI